MLNCATANQKNMPLVDYSVDPEPLFQGEMWSQERENGTDPYDPMSLCKRGPGHGSVAAD